MSFPTLAPGYVLSCHSSLWLNIMFAFQKAAGSLQVLFSPSTQRNAFANDTIPSESYISAIQAAHLGTLSNQSLPLASSLKHILLTLVRLTGDLIV